MKLSSLLQPWIADLTHDCEIFNLKNDSRLVSAGDLFIAYPGALVDGRLYINDAIAKGASAIIYEANGCENFSNLLSKQSNISYIQLDNLSVKFSKIVARFFGNPSRQLNITGITGTNGKTTIAYQLAAMYELLGKGGAYIGTLGSGCVNALNPLINTTPDALILQSLFADFKKDDKNYVAMEVSSHALSQKRVDEVNFQQAIYTNLSHDHLDYHHTLENYAKEKAKLFSFPTLKSVIINNDDAYAPIMLENVHPLTQKITYGLTSNSDIYCKTFDSDLAGSNLQVLSPWGEHNFRINLAGKFNIYNSLAIFTSLLLNGFEVKTVELLMAQLNPVPGRVEIIHTKPTIIIDYAHTPDALKNILMSLNSLKQGRLIVIFGCGGDRDKEKRPVMGQVAEQYADIAIITSDNPRHENPENIISDINRDITNFQKVISIVDREVAIKHALMLADENDTILIAGKGHESYQQFGENKIFFKDQDIVKSLMG